MGEEKEDIKELQEDSPTDQFTEGNVDLVDLIEQPAWKTILIELVKTEKMDLWDIDISELADKYLQKINELEGSDLRLPANAILASAILLKFKSRILNIGSIEDEEELIAKRKMSEEEMQMIDGLLPELKTTAKAKEGRVSLDDLVDSIEKMLEKSKKKKGVLVRDVEKPEFQIPITEFDISERIEEILSLIKEKSDSQGLLLFSNLVEGQGIVQIVDTFIPCLFLTNKGTINMWQEDFFGEIFISLNQPNS